MRKPKLTPSEILAIAGEAMCSPNTVKRWLSGEHVQPSSETRILKAIETLKELQK